MKSFIKFGCLTASLAASAVLTAQANLIANGGFETGDFTDWTPSGNTANIGIDDLYYVHSGNYGAYLGAIGTLGYLSQTITTTPGQDYDLSFWLLSDGGTPNEFTVLWNGNAIFDQTDLPASNWQQYTFDLVATSASTTLSLGFQNDPLYFGLDDISVNPSSAVPDTATTAALLGMALAGLAGLRRTTS